MTKIDDLIKQLADPNAAGKAGRLLTRMGATAIPLIVKAIRDLAGPPGLLAEALLQIRGPDVAERFVELIFDDDTMVQLTSIEALGYLGDQRAVKPLRMLLQDDDQPPTPKQVAAIALGNLRDFDSISTLAAAMNRAEKKKERLFAVSCAVALAKLGDHRGFPIVARSVQVKSQPELRTLAAEAMCHVTGEGMLSALRLASNDKYYEVRRAAIEALYYLGTRDAAELLAQATGDKDENTANNAAVYFRRITGDELNEDPTLIQSWWMNHRDRFQPTICYRLGVPIKLTVFATMLQDPSAQFDIAREFTIYTGCQFGAETYIRANLDEICVQVTSLAQDMGSHYGEGWVYKYGARVDLEALMK